jgi:hypothetical protein
MRSTIIIVGLAVLAEAHAAVLQPRDACANGIKVRQSHNTTGLVRVGCYCLNLTHVHRSGGEALSRALIHAALVTMKADAVQSLVSDIPSSLLEL